MKLERVVSRYQGKTPVNELSAKYNLHPKSIEDLIKV